MDVMSMEAAKDWPTILQFGTGDTITEAEVEKRYRQVAKKAHPDAGGSNEAMTQVNLAKGLALAWVAKERERAALARKIEQQQRVVQNYASQYAYQQQQYGNQANSFGGQAQYANAYSQQARVVWAGTNEDVSSTPVQTKAQWIRNLFRS